MARSRSSSSEVITNNLPGIPDAPDAFDVHLTRAQFFTVINALDTQRQVVFRRRRAERDPDIIAALDRQLAFLDQLQGVLK